ncbi:eukaryotic mitochondrial regulator protein-domain-containing protein [Phellopilus nigrolimitatus]|nr:eukaryotic mitochondrial regulator protein-domain-containing protein [Phellopilus nigrolimitatus]
MSVRLGPRPRLPVSCVQPAFSRGIRLLRRSVGDNVNKWLTGPGLQYKTPGDGPNWLGEKHPFPLNPSFRPPPPVSDKTRTLIYERYMSSPRKNNIRKLSAEFGISLKRVDAILRLKSMEAGWEKGKQLQTGFVAGMERILGATELASGTVPASRLNVTAADLQDQDESDDHARDRYQRLFWEPVVEGEEPVLPKLLEQAKDESKAARAEAAKAMSNIKLLTGRENQDGPATLLKAENVIIRAAQGRAGTVFKDVGGRFLDVDDRSRRIHEADRRKQSKNTRQASDS